MAAEFHDHIHLDTSNPPAATYVVTHGTLDATPMVPVVVDRALTGKLHTHRLVDDEGDPVQFNGDRMRLKLTWAEMVTVRSLAARTAYYVPHYHDDDEDGEGSLEEWGESEYVVRCLLVLRPGAITNLDPKAGFWLVNIELVDDSAVT